MVSEHSAPNSPPIARHRSLGRRVFHGGGRAAFTFVVLGGALVAWLVARARHEPLPPLLSAPVAASTLPSPTLPGGDLELTGRLLDQDGVPVAEGLLALRAGERPYWTYSAGDGGFLLAGLPPGRHALCALAPPHPPGWFEVELPATGGPLELRLPADPPPLEVLPETRRSPLRGRLVPGGGSRAEGCQVLLLPAPGADPLTGLVSRRATVDRAGRFAFEELVHGSYFALVLPPLAIASTGPELLRRELGHDGSGVELLLPLRCGAIGGTLADEAGRPLVGASVLARLEGQPDAVRATVSDEGGGFRLEHLPPGSWRVRVRAGRVDAERVILVTQGRFQPLDLGPLGVEGS